MGATSSDDRSVVVDIARLLTEHLAEDTVVLGVRELCSWTDYLIITTVRSQTHLRSLVDRLMPVLKRADRPPKGHYRSNADQGWVLVDCGSIVIHLMNREKRDFYELEKLWFEGETISY
jgi:ribosome-associated protein